MNNNIITILSLHKSIDIDTICGKILQYRLITNVKNHKKIAPELIEILVNIDREGDVLLHKEMDVNKS